MNLRRTAFIVALVALVVAAGLVWINRERTAPTVTFTTLAGKPITPSDLRGKVVLVNFWATTCAVCAHELPEMVATYQTYAARGFEIIAVAMPYDRPDWVVDYARRRQLPFTVALDFDGTINRAFGRIEATPTAFLIDKRGRIVRRTVGQPDFAELRTRIQRELDREIRS
ncbi:MAG TPA: TlpA disulfide reductase family protein [Burkholderiales bacterium]|nr:TlpA disulfide reductase family protein [Burkholderiales bacterium]